MVKRFQIVEQLSCNPELFVTLFWFDQAFSQHFHKTQGDKDVYISDWVKQSNEIVKRVCFFTMKDTENTNVAENTTRCLETQTCKTTNDAGILSYQIVCSIVPENNFGSALFKIESIWNILPSTPNCDHCSIEVDITVDCTKKMWGVSDMIESLLATEVSATYKMWFEIAKLWNQNLMDSQTQKIQSWELINGTLLQSSVHGMYVELKKGKSTRVLKGTEKLVQIMKCKSEIQIDVK
mmetsp:Transcript_6930/g.9577  ORF Transcript_6930/g.9577 Transcript_6930/m.9577 type:complete len:237 (-) Transcript_6930:12-722(-)